MDKTKMGIYSKEYQVRPKRLLNTSTRIQMITEARRHYYKGNQLLYGVIDSIGTQLVADYDSYVERVESVADCVCKEIEIFVRGKL